ncbi:ribosomal protein RPL28 [Besnoitia besnoiti]|uniref:Large ribosomal subunit protein bL28c n=1 Tax=Besnoitia besnoiti TaxID=94643 RepID=A0A2A9M6F4_BESBE|nr:ribosomal protein RPL28 [Besnoitia besnoiti]PFH31891.1 ribosomal protein RPL28 [Besnoitia besnoiti]
MQRRRAHPLRVFLLTHALLGLISWLTQTTAYRLSAGPATALSLAAWCGPHGDTAQNSFGRAHGVGCQLGVRVGHLTDYWQHGSLTALELGSRRHLQVIRRKKKYRTAGTSTVRRHFGIKGRGGGKLRLGKNTGVPLKAMERPARRCMLLGKMDNTKAQNRSHSRIATHRVQRLNLHWKRLWWPEAGYYVRLRLSVKGIRTIKKYGLQRAADKFGLNLKKKKYYAGYSHRYVQYLQKQPRGTNAYECG